MSYNASISKKILPLFKKVGASITRNVTTEKNGGGVWVTALKYKEVLNNET